MILLPKIIHDDRISNKNNFLIKSFISKEKLECFLTCFTLKDLSLSVGMSGFYRNADAISIFLILWFWQMSVLQTFLLTFLLSRFLHFERSTDCLTSKCFLNVISVILAEFSPTPMYKGQRLHSLSNKYIYNYH